MTGYTAYTDFLTGAIAEALAAGHVHLAIRYAAKLAQARRMVPVRKGA